MSLKIVKVSKNGDADHEFIFFSVTETVDVNNFMLGDRTYKKSGELSNLHRHFYRFPKITVQKGNYVILYSGNGNNKWGEINGVKTLYLYWGSKAPIWNDAEVEQAELLQVKLLETKTAD